MQLAEELDDFVLCRRFLAEARGGRIPDLLHAALPVHHAEHEIRFRAEAMRAARQTVSEDVPELAAVFVAVHACVRAQPRLQRRDAVPGRAEEHFRHGGTALSYGNQDHSCKRSQSTA